jgi:hypothetical protein
MEPLQTTTIFADLANVFDISGVSQAIPALT